MYASLAWSQRGCDQSAFGVLSATSPTLVVEPDMDDLDDDELTRLIERLRLWLFDEPPLDGRAADGFDGTGRSTHPPSRTTVGTRDAPPVRDDRSG